MSDHEVTMPARLPAGTPGRRQPPAGPPGAPADAIMLWLVGSTVDEVERELILQTLAHCYGNRTHAASVLGISVRTLRNKIKDYVARGFAVTEPSQLRFTKSLPRVSPHERPRCP
jgi:two-component system response regulator FlrC